MGVIIPPGYAQCLMPSTRVGDNTGYLVTWGVRLTSGGVTQAQVTQSDDDFRDAWSSSFPNDAVIGPLTMRVGSDGDPVIWVSTLAPSVGGNSAEYTTQNVAMLLRKNSALGGRRNRGRMYMPVVTEASVSEVGVLTSGQIASWQTIATTWLGYINSGAGNGTDGMVILHSQEPALPALVTSLTVQQVVATQRRRLRR